MKTSINCSQCGTSFLKENNEINRAKKRGMNLYCTRRCLGIATFKNIPPEKLNRDTSHLAADNRKDELSPFRWHIRNAERRTKEFTLTPEDLKAQWEKQGGRCPYTGWELKNMPSSAYASQLPSTPDRASLDRKDSSKGYTPDNIQFVSMMANYAKNRWNDKELFEFCSAVNSNRST